MILRIPAVLAPDAVREFRTELEHAPWVDGSVTAGHQSAQAKHNEQVDDHHPIARALGDRVVAALEQTPLFISAALPLRVFPPLFNRYGPGQTFGNHVDNAIRQTPNGGRTIRTDLSATLFLSAPQEYTGGELVIGDGSGGQRVKLAAGDLVLYPATSLHRVEPVTAGARIAAFFWIQSMVRDDGRRSILFELDEAIRNTRVELGGDRPAVLSLVNVYHNLVRAWAEV
jgi:PKHD-type hydroxylase